MWQKKVDISRTSGRKMRASIGRRPHLATLLASESVDLSYTWTHGATPAYIHPATKPVQAHTWRLAFQPDPAILQVL